MIRKFTKTFLGCFSLILWTWNKKFTTCEIDFDLIVKISTIGQFSFHKSHLLDSRKLLSYLCLLFEEWLLLGLLFLILSANHLGLDGDLVGAGEQSLHLKVLLHLLAKLAKKVTEKVKSGKETWWNGGGGAVISGCQLVTSWVSKLFLLSKIFAKPCFWKLLLTSSSAGLRLVLGSISFHHASGSSPLNIFLC